MASPTHSLPSGMKHVERRELYTSFQKRLAYLHAFLEFGKDDIDTLAKAQPFIKSLIPTVAEAVYSKILENDITAQALITQSTKEECTLDEDDFYDRHSMNVKCRHMFVRWYLTKVNSDPSKPEYWEYMHKLGAMHNGMIRRQPLHVDVIHFSLMLGYIQATLNEAIITSHTIPMNQKAPLVTAWTKIFWIQNDLFTKWHVKEGDEYGQRAMHDEAMKIMPDSKAEGQVMRDEEGRVAKCPFSGMTKLKGGAYVYRESESRPIAPSMRIGSIESIYAGDFVGSAPN